MPIYQKLFPHAAAVNFAEQDSCIYESSWADAGPMDHDDHYARTFIFGDSHYNTHHFVEDAWHRAPKELLCAATASALVSPIVSIIDKCLAQELSGTKQLMKAIGIAGKDMVRNPRTFFGGLSFRLTFAVYFGTYATANLSELILDMQQVKDTEIRKEGKVAASGAANIGLLAWRDSIFAQTFGKGAQCDTPLRTLGFFAIRDMSTMFATFYVAPEAADYLVEKHGVEHNIAELGCALSFPAAMQVLTAPFHIHAMDYYANPSSSITSQERWAVVKKDFATVSFARGFRILPAFGLGSFGNNKFREMFIRQDWDDELLPIQRRLTSLVKRATSRGQAVHPEPMLATSGKDHS